MDEEIYIELPEFVPPELRLYYDDNGSVICYTCDILEGNYIIVTPDVFAQGRPDIKVIDGKVQEKFNGLVLSILEKSTTGTTTVFDDISIVVDSEYKGKKQQWELKHYEL